MKDYYAILGVDRRATPDQVKKAFRDMAKKFHPDVNKGPDAESRFKEINEAYAVLSDPDKRRQYDTFGAEGFGRRYSQEDIFRGFDFESVFSDLFGGGGGGEDILSRIFGTAPGPSGRKGARGRAGRGGTAFETFHFGGQGGFPGGGGGTGPFAARGQDREYEMTISLEDAFHGGRHRIDLGAPGGNLAVDVAIPPGICDGQKLRLAGRGGPGAGGGPPGDVLLLVRIASHPRFSREGDDLALDLDVPVTTLALGGEVEVPTMGGTQRRLKVKKGTANGTRVRVRSEGMPAGARRGDLYVTLRARLPEKLTAEQERLFSALRDTGT